MSTNDKLQRPISTRYGVVLIVLSLLFGVVMSIIFPTLPHSSFVFEILVQGLAIIILAAISYGIYKGKKWVLNLYLILFVIGSLFLITVIHQYILKSEIVHLLVLFIQTLMQFAALIMLYSKESRNWFKLCKKHGSGLH